jgi:4-diphosphocytidyl-2-C-methyl-D-erythritol kinase
MPFRYPGSKMAHIVTVLAPAKVNLHLEVLGIRDDGYHEIRSIFQAVSLFDELRIRPAGPQGSLLIEGEFGFPAELNTICRAIELFRAETGAREGLKVEVEKRIPMGGGLGGGSSDAAAALRGLEAVFGLSLPPERLSALGGALGSDVPFFLSSVAAVVEGRGERVQDLAPRDDFAIIAVTPPSGVSTAEAYRWLDEQRGGRTRRTRHLPADRLAEMYRRPVENWDFFNDFDPAVFPKSEGSRRARDELRSAGGLNPRLTGSGSTVIALAPDERSAEACARRMAIPAGVRILRPLAMLPPLG